MKRKCILCGLVLLQIFIAVGCQKTVPSYPSGGFQNLGTSEESNDPLNRRSGGEYCETSDIKLESNQGLVLTVRPFHTQHKPLLLRQIGLV